MSLDSPKPINPTNELAKERNRAAAERTMTAWIGNCLTLIGIGFGLNEIQAALAERFPERASLTTMEFARTISIGFVVAGILLLVIALIQHQVEVNSIEEEEYIYLPIYSLNRLVLSAIVIFSTVGIITILFSL